MRQITGDFIDLKINPDLMDPNFNGYKLSLDSYRQCDIGLPSPVLYLQAGNSQFGLEYLKLFNEINYLYFDAYYSSQSLNRFYVFLEGCYLYSYTFDGKAFSSSQINAKLESYSTPGDLTERYPFTLSIADENIVFVSNGSGTLLMFFTGERDTNNSWKEAMSLEVEFAGRKIGPFVIIESRRFGEDRIEVLLRSIVSREKAYQKESNCLFWNKLNWISFRKGNKKWNVKKIREVICKGRLEMATFDLSGEDIILIGTEDYMFSPAASPESMEMIKDLADSPSRMVQSQNANNEKKEAAYLWAQTSEEVTVLFKFPEKIEKADISLRIEAASIHLAHKGSDLLNGKLGGLVDTSLSTFTIDGGKLELTMFKAELCGWTEVVIGDERGVMEYDRAALEAAYIHLEQFTSEFSVSEDTGTNSLFNTGQLEECDLTTDDISKILWISGEKHTIKHTSDITGNTVLFTLAVPGKPKDLCLRMDVDGVLWSFSDQDSEPIVHKATFNAFGYVQASKSQKRFSTCSPDFTYSAIIEAKRRAYIYWQSAPLNSELRNRHSGQRVTGVSKQCLISISTKGELGELEAVSDIIVGVYAASNTFFILTTYKMALNLLDNQFQFAEMNIRYTGDFEKLLSMLRRAVRMGYDSIVINTDVGDPARDVGQILTDDCEPPRKRKKKSRNMSRENTIPDPIVIKESALNSGEIEASGRKLRLFSRLTVTVSDSTDIHMLMHNPQVRKYDLLAIRAHEEQTLQTLSRKGDFVDIVTYRQDSASVQWLTKSKLIQSCISAGISFEISYADALKDASRRRPVLTNGRQLMLATRGGRGVVLDSGAEEMIDLRGPFDVANLSILFGVCSKEARKFISGNAKNVLHRAEARKTLKGALVISNLRAVPSRSLSSKCALQRLIQVPEFKTQIEVISDERRDDSNA